MGVPKSVVKINKNGVHFTSSVDKVSYTIHELTRAALRDSGKFIAKLARAKMKKVTGRAAKNLQYFVKSRQPTPSLEIGFKPKGFYGSFQELGTEKTPKLGILKSTVEQNIPMIIQMQSQYLSALEDEAKALSLLDENDEGGDGE